MTKNNKQQGKEPKVVDGRLKVSDIPDSMLQQIRKTFEEDARIRQMRVQQAMFQRTGKFAEALTIAKELEMIYNRVVAEYLEEAEASVEKIDLQNVNMKPEDKDEMITMSLALFMCCDIIDTLIMDQNDLIHRYDKTLQFEMFDEIRDLTKMVKEKMQFLQSHSKFASDLFWCDKTDDMYEMIKNKANSIRKKSQTKDWGKNMEQVKNS